MATRPGEACWMRAGDPLTLHWLGPPTTAGMLRAWCGALAPEPAWRCVDDDEISLAECAACVAAVDEARADGASGRPTG